MNLSIENIQLQAKRNSRTIYKVKSKFMMDISIKWKKLMP